MENRKIYEQALKWRNITKSHRQEKQYNGTLYEKQKDPYEYYELPEDYYGFKRARRPAPPRKPPTPTPSPRRIPFSPLPKTPTPQPQQPPLIPVHQASPANSRYPLIPVAPPNPPFYSPEPSPIIASSTPIIPYRYEPLYKPRPQPVFPPLVPVEVFRGDADRGYSYRRRGTVFSDVPGYNAVGSILRSLRMQTR